LENACQELALLERDFVADQILGHVVTEASAA